MLGSQPKLSHSKWTAQQYTGSPLAPMWPPVVCTVRPIPSPLQGIFIHLLRDVEADEKKPITNCNNYSYFLQSIHHMLDAILDALHVLIYSIITTALLLLLLLFSVLHINQSNPESLSHLPKATQEVLVH